MDFTEGLDGVCPPRDARCCPYGADECSVDELREAGMCEMADEADYGVNKARCTNDKVCRPVGLDVETIKFACLERCEEPQTACLDAAGLATCTDVNTDRNNCGGCFTIGSGKQCNPGEQCKNAECKPPCSSGEVLCDDECIDPLNNNDFCGAEGACAGNGRGEKCEKGRVCSAGICSANCMIGQILCDEKCIDPQTDNRYCGATEGDCTDKQCGSGKVCSGGNCSATCLSGQVLCGGQCIDPKTDNRYCGATAGNCA
ncbi:MAG: hypothetical protein ACOX8U_10595, partial [Bradymonadia bacterium]